MDGAERKRIFAARTADDERLVEDLLRSAGIAYRVSTGAAEELEDGRVCALLLFYEVAAGDVKRARELLLRGGAAHGLLPG